MDMGVKCIYMVHHFHNNIMKTEAMQMLLLLVPAVLVSRIDKFTATRPLLLPTPLPPLRLLPLHLRATTIMEAVNVLFMHTSKYSPLGLKREEEDI